MLELGTADPPRRGPFPCACSQLPTPLLLLPAASSCFPSPSFFTRFWGSDPSKHPMARFSLHSGTQGLPRSALGGFCSPSLVSFPQNSVFSCLLWSQEFPFHPPKQSLGNESQGPRAALGSGQPLLFQRNLFQYSHS